MTVARVPIPTNVFEHPSFIMSRLHNIIESGFLNILDLLRTPPTDDLSNFLGYCDAWATMLIGHHDAEENSLFPILNTKLDFSAEQEQHKKVFSSIEKFTTYVRAARADNTKFDASLLTEVLAGAKKVLLTHLHDEIEHLEASRLRAVFSETDIKKMTESMRKYSLAHQDPFVALPFIVGHTPPEYRSWPRLPWMVANVILPQIIARKHSGWWKYAPYRFRV
ncbi:hypothetical protein V1525DRAFT_72747 [Lipomyces kononenkoae]|uniref:Uncharacterized protein n=1 Tax=Lipomyces kononenkoae TaxID=34357 RepID=A0ACC3SRL5_LIPKO